MDSATRKAKGYTFGGRLQTYDFQSILSRLGTVSDAKLAAEIGCTKQRVQQLRQSLAIPAYAVTRRADLDKLLGRYLDTELARAFGWTRVGVGLRRRKAGIKRANVKAANARRRLEDYLKQISEA